MIDLHTHSTFSDGTLTPTQLFRRAEEAGLTAVALTDHNSVAGLPEFLTAAQSSAVAAVPGIEFSTDYLGTELHILGLWVTPEHFAVVTEKMDQMRCRKERSNVDLVNALGAAGIRLDYDQIRSRTPDGYVNRAVIAAEMVRLGYCENVKDAFARYLSPKHGYYVPPCLPDAFAVIRFIKSIGAAAVLAHPFLNLSAEELRIFLKPAKEAGLDGMEVFYPLYSPETAALACDIAGEFGLCFSGGTDFHGENKPDICLGTGRGEMNIPDAVLTSLKKCAQHKDTW